MKKTYNVEDLDCANCAAKIETAIKKMDGVNDCSVNFMTQKIIVDADEENFLMIEKKLAKTVKKADSDCTIYIK